MPWFPFLILAAILLALAWHRRLRWKPAYALRLGLLALALLAATTPTSLPPTPLQPPTRQILILDQSDSIPPDVRLDALAQAKTWQMIDANRLVISFGTQAIPVTGDVWPTVNGRATNLAEALTLAQSLLRNDPGQIILTTDAHPTDSLTVQALLANIQNPVQIIPLETLSDPNDLAVGTLYAPPSMWAGLDFQAILPLFNAPANSQLEIHLVVDDTPRSEWVNTTTCPSGFACFNIQAGTAEIMTISVSVQLEGDPRPENNTAYAAVRIFPEPHILIVTEKPEFAEILATSTGVEADIISPSDFPPNLAELEPYQVILLHNFLATSLTEAQMLTLKDFTSQLGRGLIFLGGRNAYTLGGYKDTLLETLLPVHLEPPSHPQKGALTLVLAFDRSSSMGSRGNERVSPLALAREAALRSIETLGPEDYLGLLAFSDDAGWIVPLGPISENGNRALEALTQVTASGGTSIYNALNEAVNELLANPTTNTRHIILLSDGQSADGTLQDFTTLAQFARSQGLTVSTIALGADADHELMSLIAEAGGGRFYPVLQATDLPKILVSESQAARGDNLVEGQIRPIANENEPDHPILSLLRLELMPSLNGYNALRSKSDQGAEDVLVSDEFGDPLISVWQYGLGRVVAYTSDIGEEWATSTASWNRWGDLWKNIILYALPDPSLGPGQVEIEVLPETVHLLAQLQTPTGVPLNGLQVIYSYSDAEGNIRTYQMSQTAPGIYELMLPRPPEGVYRGVVRYKIEDDTETRTEIAAPLIINYPIEWQSDFARDNESPTESRLDQWILASGGAITSWEAILVPPQPPASPGPTPQQTLSRLILALLILWPVEIAVRRRWMPWR